MDWFTAFLHKYLQHQLVLEPQQLQIALDAIGLLTKGTHVVVPEPMPSTRYSEISPAMVFNKQTHQMVN